MLNQKLVRFAVELAEAGIRVMLHQNNISIDDGFYKSSRAVLTLNQDGDVVAETRYDQKDIVRSVADVVFLSYDWWTRSKDRVDSWQVPDERWEELYNRYVYGISN